PSATAQSGIDIATQPVVRLRDGNGNNVPQANVNITATVSTGGTLAGTLTVATDASGVASFTDLAISGVVGNYTLSFAATGLTGGTSNSIALTAGTAVKLGVNRQPSATAQSGVAIAVQPRIQIQDAAGNSVSQAGTTITASFASGTGTLTNATATTSGAGLATFAGLAITGTVGSYTLQYDAAGVPGLSTNPITPEPGGGGPCDHHGAAASHGLEWSCAVDPAGHPAARRGRECGFPRRHFDCGLHRLGHWRLAQQYRRDDRRNWRGNLQRAHAERAGGQLHPEIRRHRSD